MNSSDFSDVQIACPLCAKIVPKASLPIHAATEHNENGKFDLYWGYMNESDGKEIVKACPLCGDLPRSQAAMLDHLLNAHKEL